MKKFTLMLAAMLSASAAIAAPPDNGIYEIQHYGDTDNSRGYLVQNVNTNTLHPAEAKLSGYKDSTYCYQSRIAESLNSYWYLYTNEAGDSYIFSVENGKFIAYGNGTTEGSSLTLSDSTEAAAFTIETSTKNSDYYQINIKGSTTLCLGNSIGHGINAAIAIRPHDDDAAVHAFNPAPSITIGDSILYNALIKIEELSPISALSDLSTDCLYTINSLDRGYLYYDEANAGYVSSTSAETISDDTPTGAANEQFAFLRTENTGKNQYYIYNVASQKFLTYSGSGVALGLTENPSYSWSVVENNYYLLIKIPGTSQTYINVTNATNGAEYGCKVHDAGPDEGNRMEITQVPAAMSAEVDLPAVIAKVEMAEALSAAQAALSAAETATEGYSLGLGVGQYSGTNGADIAALIAAVEAAMNGTSATALNAAVQNLNEAVTTVNLNMPQVGKFYRFQNVTDTTSNYISAVVSNSRLQMQADANANKLETVFYYDGTSLVALQDGKVIGQFIKEDEDNSWRTLLKTDAKAGSITFGAVAERSKYSIEASSGRYLFGKHTNVNCGHTISGDDIDGYYWTITEVTELPIVGSEKELVAVYSPVALDLIDDVSAYSASVSGSTVPTDKLMGGVPANAPTLLKFGDDVVRNSETGLVYLPVSAEETVTPASEEVVVTSPLSGSVYATIADSEMKYYTTQNHEVTIKGETVVAVDFLSYSASDSVIPGFAAYIATTETPEKGYFEVTGDGSTDIEEILAGDAATANSGIFDLQGRRLSAPVKGINIINGKKVLVK